MQITKRGGLAVLLGAGCLMTAATMQAQPPRETFTATASVTSPSAGATAPVVIRIDRYASAAERARLVDVVKTGDDGAICDALSAMPDAGSIEVGNQRAAIKYAYQRPSGGRLITVVTAEPLFFLGAAAPDAKSKAGHEIALALLVLDDQDHGDGELAPASTVKVDDKGAIVTRDYGRDVVRLVGIAKTR